MLVAPSSSNLCTTKYEFQDEWEVVNLAERVNDTLLLQLLATKPIAIILCSFRGSGPSVGQREEALHVLRIHSQKNTKNRQLAI